MLVLDDVHKNLENDVIAIWLIKNSDGNVI